MSYGHFMKSLIHSLVSTLITDHGLDSSPHENFLSLLGGASTSPPLHQFLVNSLAEVCQMLVKAVCGARKELQLIVLNHLQIRSNDITKDRNPHNGISRSYMYRDRSTHSHSWLAGTDSKTAYNQVHPLFTLLKSYLYPLAMPIQFAISEKGSSSIRKDR
ncbi:hypothetical protein Ddye_009741 [Dipteronia dyeriana]|uniref:Anaphase-promoting complex subunit 4 n=1 Tax=Dipteronia dyeriana TaxID=168575 RepID=A0AAD9XC06_9ROSI|nr:hypothetical protein Ddye_009741 [Dipteronia dyeriana]